MPTTDTPNKLLSLQRFLQQQRQLGDWPEVFKLNYVEEEASIELALLVPSNLACFAGHFPSQAVLPGVVQIHWAGEFAKHLFGLKQFKSLQGSKFNSMVLPEAQLSLQLQYRPTKQSVKFVYFDQNTKYSLGTIGFADPAPELSL